MKLVWAASAAVLLGTSLRGLSCDCTSGVPYRFEAPVPNPYPAKFVLGFTTALDLYSVSGNRRIVLRENYGYSIFSLSSPGAPSYLGAFDIEGQAGYQLTGDGNQTVGDVVAAGDGSRILVNYTQFNHGTLLMSPSMGPTYGFAGEFGSSGGTVTVTKVGARYLGFALQSTTLKAADVTNFVVGAGATTLGSISSATVVGAPGSSSAISSAGSFLAYASGTNVVVVNVSNPGMGAALAVNFTTTLLPATSFGLPAGTAMVSATAAIHPVDGMLYVLAEGITGTGAPAGVRLVRSANGSVFTPVGGLFTPGASWTSSQGVLALAPTSSDLVALFWERNSAAGVSKLFTMSASAFGTDLSPTLTIDSAVYPDFPRAFRMRAFATGTQIYAYVGAQQAGYAFGLTCLALADVVAPTVAPPTAVTVLQTACE